MCCVAPPARLVAVHLALGVPAAALQMALRKLERRHRIGFSDTFSNSLHSSVQLPDMSIFASMYPMCSSAFRDGGAGTKSRRCVLETLISKRPC